MARRIARPPLGWPLLPLPDEEGRLSWPTLEESIRQQIQVILQTRPREQLMRADFGAGVQDFVGRPDTVATRRLLQETITAALARWEDRAQLEAVDVSDDPAQPGSLLVEIRYRVRHTGVPQRVGLTLPLENG